jgi:hypothetical protein
MAIEQDAYEAMLGLLQAATDVLTGTLNPSQVLEALAAMRDEPAAAPTAAPADALPELTGQEADAPQAEFIGTPHGLFGLDAQGRITTWVDDTHGEGDDQVTIRVWANYLLHNVASGASTTVQLGLLERETRTGQYLFCHDVPDTTRARIAETIAQLLTELCGFASARFHPVEKCLIITR